VAFIAAHPSAQAVLWGALAALALPPWHLLPVLVFSVPAFLRLLTTAQNWRHAGLLGWCFGFGTALLGLYWIAEPMLTEVADFWWLVPFADPLLSFAVAFYAVAPAIAAYFAKPGLARILVFAGTWVLANIVQQFAFTGFPWNLWGTDWALPGNSTFLQPAAFAGVHGLTLLTILVAGLAGLGRRGLIAAVVALAVWGGFGEWRMATPVPDTAIKLALVQPDFPVPGLYDRASLQARWAQLKAQSAAGLAAGASAVIWPEGASPWLLESDYGARADLTTATGTAPILAGSFRVAGQNDYRNSLVVLAGPVPALAVYDKWKLVPFGEYMPKWIPVKITPDVLGTGFSPGPGPRTIHVSALPPFGPLICYEDVFSGEMIDEAERPAWLVVITDDSWFGDSAGPAQHFADARLRAVEEGLPLARDANAGISAMINPYGQVTAYLPLNSQDVMIASLPGALPGTLYERFGLAAPALLSLCAILSGILISLLF
jgi:apolipoprotein N-acyltransferase